MDITVHTIIFTAENSQMVVFITFCNYIITKPPVSWRSIIHWPWHIVYDNCTLFRVACDPPLNRLSITVFNNKSTWCFNELMHDWRHMCVCVCVYVYECALLERWVYFLHELFLTYLREYIISYHLLQLGYKMTCYIHVYKHLAWSLLII